MSFQCGNGLLQFRNFCGIFGQSLSLEGRIQFIPDGIHLVLKLAEDEKVAGTLYVESTMGAVYERLRLYGGLAALIIFGSALVALGVSSALQRRVTEPILALVGDSKGKPLYCPVAEYKSGEAYGSWKMR